MVAGKRMRCRQCGCTIHDPWWVVHAICETCARTGLPNSRYLWYRRIEEEVARMTVDGTVETLAHRPTTAQPGSLERLKAYAARIACGEPIFHPLDAGPQ